MTLPLCQFNLHTLYPLLEILEVLTLNEWTTNLTQLLKPLPAISDTSLVEAACEWRIEFDVVWTVYHLAIHP